MKNRWALYLLLSLTLVAIGSCRRACFNKKLPKKCCEKNYVLVATETIADYYKPEYPDLVNNQDTSGAELPYTILKSCFSGYAAGYEAQYFLCYNAATRTWKMRLEYSLEGQCQGSGLGNMGNCYYVKCPKIPEDDKVIFEAVDINPMPD